jgi:hypothetical protein
VIDRRTPCKLCGAPLVWIVTPAGKRMPCDAARVTIVTEDGRVVSGHVSHFATCPRADEARRRNG